MARGGCGSAGGALDGHKGEGRPRLAVLSLRRVARSSSHASAIARRQCCESVFTTSGAHCAFVIYSYRLEPSIHVLFIIPKLLDCQKL